MFDSTYVECDVSLTNGNGKVRGYRQVVTYNPDSSRYEVLYLYNGTAMRVLEFGHLSNGELKTWTTLSLPGGKVESIDCSLKMINKDELFFESRSSETRGEVDYTCRYVWKE